MNSGGIVTGMAANDVAVLILAAVAVVTLVMTLLRDRRTDVAKALERIEGDMTQRLTRIEGDVKDLGGEMRKLGDRVGAVETRLAIVETKVGAVESRLAVVETRVEDLRRPWLPLQPGTAAADTTT